MLWMEVLLCPEEALGPLWIIFFACYAVSILRNPPKVYG